MERNLYMSWGLLMNYYFIVSANLARWLIQQGFWTKGVDKCMVYLYQKRNYSSKILIVTIPFKPVLLGEYTMISTFLPWMEVVHGFSNNCDLTGISTSMSNLHPLGLIFLLAWKKKPQGVNSGKHEKWGMSAMLWKAKGCSTARVVLSRHIIVLEHSAQLSSHICLMSLPNHLRTSQ